MVKIKWIGCSIPKSILEISEVLQTLSYKRGQELGFEITEVRRSSIRGRFIEAFIDREVFTDPFGEEIVNDFTRYSVFNFQIEFQKKNRYLIRIESPPRSLKAFVSSLSNACGFGFTANAFAIDILQLIDVLAASELIDTFRISRMKISGVKINEHSLARLEIFSTQNAYDEVREKLNIRSAKLEKVTLEINKDPYSQLEITSSGNIVGNLPWIDTLAPLISSYFSAR